MFPQIGSSTKLCRFGLARSQKQSATMNRDESMSLSFLDSTLVDWEAVFQEPLPVVLDNAEALMSESFDHDTRPCPVGRVHLTLHTFVSSWSKAVRCLNFWHAEHMMPK